MVYLSPFVLTSLLCLGRPLPSTPLTNHPRPTLLTNHPCPRHNEAVCPHEYIEGRIVKLSSCPLVLECWDNGLFAPNQCRTDGMCFCVNVT